MQKSGTKSGTIGAQRSAVPFRRSSVERFGTIFDKHMKNKDKKRNDFSTFWNDPFSVPLPPFLRNGGGMEQWNETQWRA